MLGNNVMEIDNLILSPAPIEEEPSASISAAVDSEIIQISDVTPVKRGKKRRISETGGTEDASKKTLSSTSTTTTLNNSTNSTLNINSPAQPNTLNSSIRADIKRILQSPDSELAKFFQIKSNNKLVLVQGQVGEAPYRHHPDTIRELSVYFNDLHEQCRNIENGFNFIEFLRQKYSGLIGKLVQDSQVSQSELLAALKTILLPIGSGFPEFQIDSSLLDGLVEKSSFGHPEAGNNFTAWSCTFWQVKDLNLLGESIGQHFLKNFVLRNAAKMILENSLKAETKEDAELVNPVNLPATAAVVNVDDLPMNLMKIESGTATPKKREREKEKKEKQQNQQQGNANASTPSATAQTVKISSFFAKLKKPDGAERIPRVTGEYFQPFFVKPDVTLAPHNQLKALKQEKLKDTNNNDYPLDYWKEFKSQRVKIPFMKQTCLCVGYDGKPVRAVLKLFKFEENYRPAYLGTWRKTAPVGSVGARRPFGRVPEVDYEYDSDAEWDEGEDPEGESLSDLDDEDEELDEDEEGLEVDDEDGLENASCAGSVDSWLVPHGYLSDDEGVADEIHLGELEDAAREAELFPPPQTAAGAKKKEKKKFIPKEPVLFGPFFGGGDQIIPQILQANSIQFIGSLHSFNNPFTNYEAVFSNLESTSSTSSLAADSGTKKSQSSENLEKNTVVFPETLLPSLIQIINMNPSAGITKLYDEFTLKHGKAVSRRLFESKLNQITLGKLKCEKTGKLRWIFKEEYSSDSDVVMKQPSSNEGADTSIMIID